MSVVAEYSLPVEAFCLGETLRSVPAATVELDRLVAYSPDYVIPFLWVMNTDRETFDAAVTDDSTVDEAEVSDSFDETYLYQMSWAEIVSERLQVILDHEGIILEARGSGEEWRFEVRFGSRDHFSDFREHFAEFGDVTLHQLRPPATPGDLSYGISTKQRKALLAAYDAGYYDTPSTANGTEVARQLDITQQALSARLKRGIATLIETTLGRQRDE